MLPQRPELMVGAVPATIVGTLTFAFPGRWPWVLLGGFVAGLGLFAYFFFAPADSDPLGRAIWVLLLAAALFGWTVGAGIGVGVRRALRRN